MIVRASERRLRRYWSASRFLGLLIGITCIPQMSAGRPISRVRFVALFTIAFVNTSCDDPPRCPITNTKIRFGSPEQYGITSVPIAVPSKPYSVMALRRQIVRKDATRNTSVNSGAAHMPVPSMLFTQSCTRPESLGRPHSMQPGNRPPARPPAGAGRLRDGTMSCNPARERVRTWPCRSSTPWESDCLLRFPIGPARGPSSPTSRPAGFCAPVCPERLPFRRAASKMPSVLRLIQPEILESLPHNHPAAVRNRRDLRLINFLLGTERWFARTLPRVTVSTDSFLEIGAGTGALGLSLTRSIDPIRYAGLDRRPRPRDWPDHWRWLQTDLLDFQDYAGTSVVMGSLILHQFTSAELPASAT